MEQFGPQPLNIQPSTRNPGAYGVFLFQAVNEVAMESGGQEFKIIVETLAQGGSPFPSLRAFDELSRQNPRAPLEVKLRADWLQYEADIKQLAEARQATRMQLFQNLMFATSRLFNIFGPVKY